MSPRCVEHRVCILDFLVEHHRHRVPSKRAQRHKSILHLRKRFLCLAEGLRCGQRLLARTTIIANCGRPSRDFLAIRIARVAAVAWY